MSAERSDEMAKKAKTEIADEDFVVSSGNYLKDRGYADPAETRAKLFLANQIAVAVEEMGLSQAAAAEMTGLKQPDVSRIVNGNVKEYSVWRLMTTLKALGYDIAIEVERLGQDDGHISVRNRADAGQSVTLV
jgi:predicted XRE-type DNA-binding protein